LEETYVKIIAGIDESYRYYTLRILQFLTYSERSLTMQEVIGIVIVDPTGNPSFYSNLRMPNHQDIMRVCSSMVSLVTRRDGVSKLQLTHFSVQQYVRSERIRKTFSDTTLEVGEIFHKGINEFNARASMTMICLPYLSHLGQVSASGQRDDTFPFVGYSARYWMSHAKISEKAEGVQDAILKFLVQQP
jgi:hypothetical protein